MSRRREDIVAEPLPALTTASLRIGSPSFEPVRVRGTSAHHCFSVCLYHEPTFALRFPDRDFSARYLATDAIRNFIRQQAAHVLLFVDKAMLPHALSMDFADVYLVTDPPRFPWEQHVWRYYAALLPDHPTIRAYHFRGLDNIVREDMAMLDRFVAGGFDLLRAPYTRGKIQSWTPVRGSCSVAQRGITSLRAWLRTQHVLATAEPWPEPFHVDERYLTRWFNEARDGLDVFTYLDRRPRGRVYREIQRALLKGRRAYVEGQITEGGPLRKGSG